MSVVVVNFVTIAADLQAGAPGVGLLAGVDSRWLAAPLGAGSGRAAAGQPVRPGGGGAAAPDAGVRRFRRGGAGASGLAPPAHRQPGPGRGRVLVSLTGTLTLESLLGAMISAIRRGQQLLPVVIGHLH